jgi:hypothetical protein
MKLNTLNSALKTIQPGMVVKITGQNQHCAWLTKQSTGLRIKIDRCFNPAKNRCDCETFSGLTIAGTKRLLVEAKITSPVWAGKN